jgi:hypothetical protein
MNDGMIVPVEQSESGTVYYANYGVDDHYHRPPGDDEPSPSAGAIVPTMSAVQPHHQLATVSTHNNKSSTSPFSRVSFTVEDCGKRKPQSKKRVEWHFVGRVGGGGGGSGEHVRHYKVTLLWSKWTGKERVLCNDVEVYEGRHKGASVFGHKWIQDGFIKMHVLACSMTPNKVKTSFRKYDLIINGQSFFSLPLQGGSDPPKMGGDDEIEEITTSVVDIFFPNGYSWDVVDGAAIATNAYATYEREFDEPTQSSSEPCAYEPETQMVVADEPKVVDLLG